MVWSWRNFRSDPTYIYTFSPRFKFEDNWCAFIEVFGYIWKKYKPEHSISVGLSYNINDNFRIDAAGGLKLNKERRIIFTLWAVLSVLKQIIKMIENLKSGCNPGT